MYPAMWYRSGDRKIPLSRGPVYCHLKYYPETGLNNPGNIQDGDKPKFELLNINNQPLYLLGNDSQYGCKPIGDFKT